MVVMTASVGEQHVGQDSNAALKGNDLLVHLDDLHSTNALAHERFHSEEKSSDYR
jgi:hypothetical protein